MFCILHNNRRREDPWGYYLHCIKCGRDRLVAPKNHHWVDERGYELKVAVEVPALWLEYAPLDSITADLLASDEPKDTGANE